MKSRLFLLLIAVFYLVSCQQAPTASTTEIVGLLTKSRDMFNMCVLLLNQESVIYYSLIVERYYYALFSLARIVDGPSRIFDEKKGSHELIWESCPKQVKEVYGERLKKKRVAADYGINNLDFNEASYRKELREILKNREAFTCLTDEVESIYEVRSARPEFVENCDKLMKEIEGAVETIREKV